MSDPSSEEQGDGGGGGIGGSKAGVAEVIAGVIESHQNHDDAAQQVDRFDADAYRSRGCSVRGHQTA